MKIGILETGAPPAALVPRFGTYPEMLERLLGGGFEARTYRADQSELPARPEEQEAYLVTGSPAGVYDPLPWIAPLQAFLRTAKGQAKLVGICFGHQVMAEAFGGHVEKSDKGWGVGLHVYPIVSRLGWMDEGGPAIAVPASHQDQVVLQPPSSTLIASSVFTPYAALAYTDQPAISFQFHPEFTPDFAKALIETRSERLADAPGAIASLDRPNDSARVAAWIRAFLLG